VLNDLAVAVNELVYVLPAASEKTIGYVVPVVTEGTVNDPGSSPSGKVTVCCGAFVVIVRGLLLNLTVTFELAAKPEM
jgi:hypothetical protein